MTTADHANVTGKVGGSPNEPSNRQRRICFFGHFGSSNFGNEITLQTVLHHVRSRLPGVQVACICTEPENLAATQKIESVPIRRVIGKSSKPRTRIGRWLRRVFVEMPAEPYRWFDAYKTLKRADMFVVPGTGLLTDAYGLLSWGPYNLFKWSLVARLRRCKLLVVSVGAGPLYSVLGKYFVKSALSFADFRSYRDDASMNYLKGIGFPTNSDRVYPDLVFSLPEAIIPHDGEKQKVRTIVGLGLMGNAGKYSAAKPAGITYEAYLDNLVVFAEWLLAHDYDIRLLLGEVGEWTVSQEFKTRLKMRLGAYDEERIIDEPPRSVEQLLSQLATTDMVVATRFHNVLLALVLNKPVIAISFHHKCASLMTDMRLSEYCHDINDMDAGRLIEQFQDVEKNAEKLKPVIRQRVEEFRKELDEQYDLIFKTI
jgi:polysaccharide pyruvyl transferase WcaK-like protein